MSIYFKSLRSSSSGNCLLIWTASTLVAIDCGFHSQKDCQRQLENHAGRIEDLDAVLVTHHHGDHIGYAPLRVLSAYRVRIRAHQRVTQQIRSRHGCADWDEPPYLQAFHEKAFKAGDLKITPLELPHAPAVPTFGFVVCHGQGKRRRKLVVCTDFHDYGGVLRHFMDADFIFVESNHDPDLLRENPNHASRFHLSNAKASWLLYHAIRQSKRPPQAVMLGHMSLERNRKELALNSVKEVFASQHRQRDFALYAAPLDRPSKTVCID